MKHLIFVPLLFFLQSYRPFTQDGSVDVNSDELDERIEKAQENSLQEKRAEEVIREEQQSDDEFNRKLEPSLLLNEDQKKVRRFHEKQRIP